MLQLRRITSSGRFIPEIDGLRFIAILSVVLYHFNGFISVHGETAEAQGSFRHAIEHGYRGVNLFYVLSGFILGLPFASYYLKGDPRVSLKKYFLRRLTRLEPPYILNLILCFGLLLWLEGKTVEQLLPHLGASLLYVHNLWFGEQSIINPVAWTLEVEVQFYCLAPLLAVVFSIQSTWKRRGSLLALILAAGILQLLFWDAAARIKFSILFAIQFFLAGFFLADLYVSEVKASTRQAQKCQSRVWDAVSFILWPLIFLMEDRTLWVMFPILVIGTYIAAFRGVWMNRLFRLNPITTIGGMCYTIYLWHYVLIPVWLRIGKGIEMPQSFSGQFLYFLPFLAVVCLLYFIGIERPSMANFHRARNVLKP